jgi:anti-sigma regulatory factor (Ser/Thr protein kinase)
MTFVRWEARGQIFGLWEFVSLLRKVKVYSQNEMPEGVYLDLTQVTQAFSKGLVPLIAFCDFLKERGAEVHIDFPVDLDQSEYWKKVGWHQLLSGQDPPPTDIHKSFLPVQKYSDWETQDRLVNAAGEVIARQIECEPGVLDAILWTLNELAYNVLVHSAEEGRTPVGYFQVVGHPNVGSIELVVSDSGMGIRDSLWSYKMTTSHTEAIQLAIQQGVTRDTDKGAGNGLAGAVRITEAGVGKMAVLSGDVEIEITGEGILDSFDIGLIPGTTVIVDLPTGKAINISEALWGSAPVPVFERDYLLDDEKILFSVAEEAEGFGTRGSGRELRRKLLNISNEYSESKIGIDFSNLELVSASFVDEFIGRLVVESGGLVSFMQRYALINTSQFVQRSIEETLKQRIEHEEEKSRVKKPIDKEAHESDFGESSAVQVNPGEAFIANLERLGALREQGVLSVREFMDLKERLLKEVLDEK